MDYDLDLIVFYDLCPLAFVLQPPFHELHGIFFAFPRLHQWQFEVGHSQHAVFPANDHRSFVEHRQLLKKLHKYRKLPWPFEWYHNRFHNLKRKLFSLGYRVPP